MASDAQSLNTKASQETFVSLLQLDPAPIESPNEKELPPLPEEALQSSTATLKSQHTTSSISASGSNTSSSIGLSRSGHGSVYYLSRIQRYSSYTFSIFAALHLSNTSIIPLITRSVPAAEPYLLQTREIYQTSLTEPLLIGLPIVAHVASGVALRLIRRSQNLKRYGGATPGMYALHKRNTSSSSNSKGSHGGVRIWPHLSYTSISGCLLTVCLTAHVGLSRVLPLIVEGDSSNIGLAFVAHGFARDPLISWAFYLCFLGVAASHIVWGWSKWLNIAPPVGWEVNTTDQKVRKKRNRIWLGINATAMALFGMWAAGGLGVVARAGRVEGWLAGVYDGLYAYLPFEWAWNLVLQTVAVVF